MISAQRYCTAMCVRVCVRHRRRGRSGPSFPRVNPKAPSSKVIHKQWLGIRPRSFFLIGSARLEETELRSVDRSIDLQGYVSGELG